MISEFHVGLVLSAVIEATGQNISPNVQAQVLRRANDLLKIHENKSKVQVEPEPEEVVEEVVEETVEEVVEEPEEETTTEPKWWKQND